MKSLIHRLVQIVSIGSLLLLTSACSGGSSDDDTLAEVTNMFTDNSNVLVGDDVDLTVDFTFAHDTVVDDNRNVILVVHLPAALQFEAETARIDEVGGNDKVTPLVERCADGDTFLHFDLGQNVLDNAADPSGDADGRLIMAVLGTRAVGTVSIDAEAQYDALPASCTVGLFPEDSTAITVQ